MDPTDPGSVAERPPLRFGANYVPSHGWFYSCSTSTRAPRRRT
ncbi:hypothetical protein FHU39_002374 [Flexivirga oryzae]|uniref:Uncharacterized protein n=1 Tax=Flexivirga oryzae TaxID=1794944 RepID=A0A839N3Q6_9MICO|nr:hypothetical protein [Flexivirga oryzae]